MPSKITLEIFFDPELNEESLERIASAVDNSFALLQTAMPVPEGASIDYTITSEQKHH